MEFSVHSASKTQLVEIPVGSMLPSDSEHSGSYVYTRASSFDSALPRINAERHLPNQQEPSKSFSEFPELGKQTRKSGDGLELPDVQGSKYLVSFSDLRQLEKTDTTRNLDFRERSLKVSKLLQDRIRVLENELQKQLTAVKEIIHQAEIVQKKETTTSRSGKKRRDKDSATHRQGTERQKRSVQRKDYEIKSREFTGKRLQKPNSESSISESAEFRRSSAENQTCQDANKKQDDLLATETKENYGVSSLEMSEQSTQEQKDVRFSDGDVKPVDTLKGHGLPPKGIQKQRKSDTSKLTNSTKAVKKTIRKLYKLNKQTEAENLTDLLESKVMTEKELNKAIKRELQEERDEKNRQKARNIERNRRETFFQRMEELERLEEEMRENRLCEREKRRAEALRRREKNTAFLNEKQKAILSAKISRAFKFSYFPLYIPESGSACPDYEQSSSEDSDSSDRSLSRQNSTCSCMSTKKKGKNRAICSSHSEQSRKLSKPA